MGVPVVPPLGVGVAVAVGVGVGVADGVADGVPDAPDDGPLDRLSDGPFDGCAFGAVARWPGEDGAWPCGVCAAFDGACAAASALPARPWPCPRSWCGAVGDGAVDAGRVVGGVSAFGRPPMPLASHTDPAATAARANAGTAMTVRRPGRGRRRRVAGASGPPACATA